MGVCVCACAKGSRRYYQFNCASRFGPQVPLAPEKLDFLTALNDSERRRLSEKRAHFKTGMAFDLGHGLKTLCSSEDGPLHTLIKNLGLVWILSKDRWMTPSELQTAMGMPITDEACLGWPVRRRAGSFPPLPGPSPGTPPVTHDTSTASSDKSDRNAVSQRPSPQAPELCSSMSIPDRTRRPTDTSG